METTRRLSLAAPPVCAAIGPSDQPVRAIGAIGGATRVAAGAE
jgi:hypothetical protein